MSHRHIERRENYAIFYDFPTRWSDNDQLGHLNNVMYYRFFEALVVAFSMGHGVSLTDDGVVPYAAESLCRFRTSLAFPDIVEGGLRVEKMGNSSVRYGLGLFKKGGPNEAAAYGHWVHVWVDSKTERPVPIPADVRAAFEKYVRS